MCVTYGISRMMARHKVNVERQDVSSFHGVDVVDVVLVLIPSAEVRVAFVARVSSVHGVFYRAGEIYRRSVSPCPDKSY